MCFCEQQFSLHSAAGSRHFMVVLHIEISTVTFAMSTEQDSKCYKCVLVLCDFLLTMCDSSSHALIKYLRGLDLKNLI